MCGSGPGLRRDRPARRRRCVPPPGHREPREPRLSHPGGAKDPDRQREEQCVRCTKPRICSRSTNRASNRTRSRSARRSTPPSARGRSSRPPPGCATFAHWPPRACSLRTAPPASAVSGGRRTARRSRRPPAGQLEHHAFVGAERSRWASSSVLNSASASAFSGL